MLLLVTEFIILFFFSWNLRSLDYSDDMGKKPSHMEMVTVQATAGMLAGACSSVVTTPIDTVKTRLQVGINSINLL